MDFATRLIEESGSTFVKSMGELLESVNIFRTAAGECRRVDGGIVPSDESGQISTYLRLPIGVVAGIAPFNYPFLLALNKVALALAAGNTFILKPSSDTPVSGLMIAECLAAGGLPKGVFSVIPGPGDIVGDALMEDSRVKMITFTGSTTVGRSIAVKAAANLKKYTSNGKNPLIILKTSTRKAVTIATFGAYLQLRRVDIVSTKALRIEEYL